MNNTEMQLNALVESWERRIDHLENRVSRTGCDEDQARGLQECVDDLRAYLESASPSASNAGLPAVRSTAWLDALRESVASAQSLEVMAEGGDCKIWAACHEHYLKMINLCRQCESASNGRGELPLTARED